MLGILIVEENLGMGGILIGYPHVPIFDYKNSRSIWNQVGGEIVFRGHAKIGHGSKISVNGYLEIGDCFEITAESTIIAYHRVVFGTGVLLSWDILIMDTDFHRILNDSMDIINSPKEILIGDRTWIGCRALILKGVEIANNSIIAAGSVVTKSLNDESAIYAGVPAKFIGSYYTWIH